MNKIFKFCSICLLLGAGATGSRILTYFITWQNNIVGLGIDIALLIGSLLFIGYTNIMENNHGNKSKRINNHRNNSWGI